MCFTGGCRNCQELPLANKYKEMAQQLRSGMTSMRRAIASAAPSNIDLESGIVSASW